MFGTIALLARAQTERCMFGTARTRIVALRGLPLVRRLVLASFAKDGHGLTTGHVVCTKEACRQMEMRWW